MHRDVTTFVYIRILLCDGCCSGGHKICIAVIGRKVLIVNALYQRKWLLQQVKVVATVRKYTDVYECAVTVLTY